MITIFKVCSEVEKYLKNLSSIQLTYRIYLRSNENLYVYVLLETDFDTSTIEDGIKEIYSDIEVEYVSRYELDTSSFYQEIFGSQESINIEKGRRRFTSLLNKEPLMADTTCPVVTFYSYKGGMGRSTTLASFASHLALNNDLNVFILDFDFEAPGFTNFYLKDSRQENQRQGFVEYFIDKECNFSSKANLEQYSWQVDSSFSGIGSIRIMPAGNLDTNIVTDDFLKNNLNHYLEGLSRIDFTNEPYITEKFKSLIEDVNESFSPDVILIDSRTGFNDILGISAFKLSQLVLGFFRNDAQSLPGLHFFLQNVIEHEHIQPCLVNSILPESISLKRKIFNSFKEDVQQIIEKIDGESELNFDCFPISRNQNLELLGSSSENMEDFVELIKNSEIKDYSDLFDYLHARIEKIRGTKSLEFASKQQDTLPIIAISAENTRVFSEPLGKSKIDTMSSEEQLAYSAWLKKKILNETSKKIDSTSLYAEELSIESEFDNQRFFYRNCMNDIFNIDKPFILGSKGTGKSYIYNALRIDKIVNKLRENANIKDNYQFIYTIDKKDRIFKTNRLKSNIDTISINRFWLIYTWQIVSKELKRIKSTFTSSLDSFDIRDDETTSLIFEEKIRDDNYVIKIEQQFRLLDDFYISKDNVNKDYLIILYDQLDEIVHPSLWNKWIPSLIDFWRNKRYNRIFGKVFIRRDLFNRLYGVTNVNDIDNQAINIEWSQEEMFSYFFKLVFSQGIADYFWDIMCLHNDHHYEVVRKNRIKYNKLEQTTLEEYLLRPLAVTFFGKEVDAEGSNRMGESYDWFYKNLKNADETISLRPFIDLIKFSIEKWKEKKYLNEEGSKPILFQKYYTDREVRKKAVDRHFADIVKNEIGNKPIEYLFEYIDNNKEYQYITLRKEKFYDLINKVIAVNSDKEEMKDITLSKLEELLVTNSIIKKENYGRGDEYKFPFLYKYRLGLRGK